MKKLIILQLVSIIFFTSSCISRQVTKDPSYKETFMGYFVSKRGNDVVFIGEKYHYIFKDENGDIAELSKLEWKGKLKISDISLRSDKDNNVYGSVKVEFVDQISKIPPSELNRAENLGFSDGGRYILGKKIKLKGIRYEPAVGFNISNKDRFSRQYKTKIMYDLKPSEKVAKAALTPVAYAADGLLIFAGGIWIPLAIIAFTDEDTPEKIIDKLTNK